MDIVEILFRVVLSIFFTVYTVVLYTGLKKSCNPLGGYYTFISPLLFIQVFIFTYIGAYAAVVFYQDIPRLSFVSFDSVTMFLFGITYSVFVFFLLFRLYVYFTGEERTDFVKHYQNSFSDFKLKVIVLSIVTLYVGYKYYFHFHDSPLFYLLSGNPGKAAEVRYLIQTHQLSVDIRYLSKVVELLGFYLIVQFYLDSLIKRSRRDLLLFFVTFSIVTLNLVFDAQKAPLLLVLLSLLILRYAVTKKIKSILVLSGGAVFSILVFSLATSSDDSFSLFNAMYSVFDRTIIGQNQGMYYIYDFLPVDKKDLISWLNGLNYTPADQEVVKHMAIYAGNDSIVNVNTYYLGDLWNALGFTGILIGPVVISATIIFSIFILDILLRHNYRLYFPLAFYACMSIPVTRSFYQVLSMKYLLYVLVFGVIPIFIISHLCNLGRKNG